jgi:hypothetical protein
MQCAPKMCTIKGRLVAYYYCLCFFLLHRTLTFHIVRCRATNGKIKERSKERTQCRKTIICTNDVLVKAKRECKAESTRIDVCFTFWSLLQSKIYYAMDYVQRFKFTHTQAVLDIFPVLIFCFLEFNSIEILQSRTLQRRDNVLIFFSS